VTLIEVLIVLFIVSLMMGGMVIASGAVQRSRLKSSASSVAAAMRTGFNRASATGKRLRLVIDLDKEQMWLEESSDVMLLDTKDLIGTGGADPATDAEKAALAEANRINAGVQAARASFSPVNGAAGQPQGLRNGIAFRAVDAAHDEKARDKGRDYVYFWGSEAERASVQLKIEGNDDEKDAMSVVLAPLTGKPTIADGAVPVAHPRDDAEASEAEDEGR
jgi:hypothetical protein